MSTAVTRTGWQQSRRRRLRRPAFLTAPAQGTSALVAFLLLMAVVGIAVADARRTVAPGSQETDFIAWLTVLGGAIGYVLARSSLSLLAAHTIGAAIGAAAILLALSAAITGTSLLAWPDLDELGRRMTALWGDLILLTLPETSGDGQRPWGFAMLVLGALCWTTAQFGAMSIFRHGRATPAVGAAGVLLFVDVLVPSPYRGLDPVPVAVAFATLSLFLLVRSHLAQQQAGWARRSVTEGKDVGRVFLGAGAIFITAIVIGTTALTTFAVAERGTIPWQSLARPLESVREQLLRVLEGLGVRIPPDPPAASLFSNHQEIPDRWDMGEGTAFEAATGPDGDPVPYWFGAAFDTLTRDGYDFTGAREVAIDEGSLDTGPLELPDDPVAERELVVTTITPVKDGHYTLLSPATAIGVSTSGSGTVLLRQGGGSRIGVELQPTSSVGVYDVTSLALVLDDPGGSLDADVLRKRSTRYPPGLKPFLQVPGSLIGEETTTFIERIRRRTADRQNPYDIAKEVQDELRKFSYQTEMVGVCGDRPATECLLAEKQGFCSYFAMTMTAVLREMGIPSRIVHGYLPGVAEGDGRWTVPLQAAHAWVEVWFDRVGWVRFDPTPELERFNGTATDLPETTRSGEGESSSPGPSGEPSPSPERAEPSPSPEPIDDPEAAAATTGGGPDLPTLVLLVIGAALGVLVAVGGVAVLLIRRLPDADPRSAYRGVVALASRFGHGPTPSQTEYEYARSLGEALPSVARELELVTRVHVEAVYGRRGAAGDALAVVRRAYARVRTALLRLLLRR